MSTLSDRPAIAVYLIYEAVVKRAGPLLAPPDDITFRWLKVRTRPENNTGR